MKSVFDDLSAQCSKRATQQYSTSFSLGIKLLDKSLHRPIYGIYGFVRFADEIVDSFHDYNKEELLHEFRNNAFKAIHDGISLNPILNEFQKVVNEYNIDHKWIDTFLKSMKMDLDDKYHDLLSYEEYILGSAEVVGLMCLHVFVDGDNAKFKDLKPFAMSLGSAFQKVNFLRDLKADYESLGRTYFPGIDLESFTTEHKKMIENEIEEDFQQALIGIKKLPLKARKGVYLAYVYYVSLFRKIKNTPVEKIMESRIRVSNPYKVGLMFQTMVKHQLNLL
ncbi:MAG: phytoene/squalene synthase family protein [Flavobacteriales bacterium]|jgi:phytoene/squalene synthetase|tara:strand:+ start:1537 stop:2373 length:837 start_codon:yes stop_codon:yes gene_type:complete